MSCIVHYKGRVETIDVRQLEQNAGHYLDQVRNGATLLVSVLGTVVAQLSPIGTPQLRRDELRRVGRLVAAPRMFTEHVTTAESVVDSNDKILNSLRDDRV